MTNIAFEAFALKAFALWTIFAVVFCFMFVAFRNATGRDDE